MSCPICNIGGNSYTSKQKNSRSNSGPKGPSTFGTYPPYLGPQDSITIANERTLDYPFIHAHTHPNREPSQAYLQLKAQAEKERASQNRYNLRQQVACGRYNFIREALCHLETAEKLLTH